MSQPKITEAQLWEWMMEGKTKNFPHSIIHRTALATLARNTTISKWQGHDKPSIEVKLSAGTRVKVVMVSRFGDVGITNDLDTEYGYHYRVQCIEGEFAGQLLQPENLLIDIEFLPDSQY